MGDSGRVVPVEGLDPEPALELLAHKQGARNVQYRADPAAREIVNLLGAMPLALHCAGAYLIHYGLTPAAYLDELRARASVLDHESLGDWLTQHGGTATAHTPNIAATFALSYRRLLPTDAEPAAEHPLPLRLFHLLAHCAPNAPLPRAILAQAAQVEDGKALADALRELEAAGLVSLASDLWPEIHPLMQAFARQRAPDAAGDVDRMEVATSDVAREINRAGLPARMAAVLPHLEVVATAAVSGESPNASTLLNVLGWHYDDVADYARAHAAYVRALTIT